ncbi:MAG: ImmA/IrrE family metallo-endopeptidase, partial [Candidatus Dadabacteria bacterium]|nr:ImmA/IrrE family metallo-endopeptidase [Candidatus Dadabacteria bacterium]
MIVLHRVLPEKMNDSENRSSVRRIVDLYREGTDLLKILDRDEYAGIPNYAAEIKSASIAIRHGKRVAYEERCRLCLGDAPIRDIAELLSEQAIWTAADLRDSMSGLFIHNQSTGFAVLVNAGHGLERRRFSYAHEYAHVLFDREQLVRMTLQKNSSELA